MHWGKGYKRKVHKSLRAVVRVSGTEWLGQLLEGHWPSTSGILVPLVEQECIPVELCALFIYLHVPRRPPPSCPNTRYCIGIHVTLMEETGAVPPLSHAWTAPLVDDILPYARTGLTEDVVMGPGRAVLFYGRCFLGEGLSLGESRDAAFVLTGGGTWVSKPANLAMDLLTIQEGQWQIARAITKCWIKARSPGHPCMNLLTPHPFRFDWRGDTPQKDAPIDADLGHQLSPHHPPRGQNWNWHRRDQGQPSPQPPSPSPNHGFESDRSSVSMASLMLSLSDRSEGSRCPQWGRWGGETGAHMKINLAVFKDKNTKEAVTYQSWRWDLMVYHHTRCKDHTFLPYAIWPLQGYPGELVQSSWTDITLDDVLTILDEPYNNMKALDALNQELF